MNIEEDRQEDPLSVPYDPDKEQRKLEAAGWKRVDRQGKLFWKNPQSGHLYPQGTAVARLRAIAASEEVSEESEGDT